MGRKRGEIKDSVMVRLTPDARIKVDTVKHSRARAAALNGSRRVFTNSIIIEQAIQMYFDKWNTEMNHPDTCGSCGQKRLY
jgi:hypothetical protein